MRSLSNQELPGYLGGPVGTTEQFLTTLEDQVLEPGAASIIHHIMPQVVARDEEVIKALLTNEGTSLRECIMILSGVRDPKYILADTPGALQRVQNLNVNTKEATRLLGTCPPALAWRYSATFAIWAIGMTDAEIEVFQQLTNDRADEVSFSNYYDDPDIISESAQLVRVLDAA